MNGDEYQSPVNQPGNIITGRIRNITDYTQEGYRESQLFAQESQQAEGARAVEDERKLWWSVGLGLLGALFGPIGVPIGVAAGKIVGELGSVGGKGKQAEDYLVSTDVGKFEKQQKFQLEEFNENLKTYDKSQLWTDIMDIGKAGLFAYKGGTSLKDGMSSFSPTEWGGKGGTTSMDFLSDAWKRLLPNKE